MCVCVCVCVCVCMSVCRIEMLCVCVVSVSGNGEEILFTKKLMCFAYALLQMWENRRIWLHCAGSDLYGVKW